MSEAGNKESVPMPPRVSSGKRQEEKIYFAYNATLRIFGNIPDLDEITQRLGIAPSDTHRKGDRAWGPAYRRTNTICGVITLR